MYRCAVDLAEFRPQVVDAGNVRSGEIQVSADAQAGPDKSGQTAIDEPQDQETRRAEVDRGVEIAIPELDGHARLTVQCGRRQQTTRDPGASNAKRAAEHTKIIEATGNQPLQELRIDLSLIVR